MKDFATTLHYPLRPAWNARAETLTADGPSTPQLLARLVAAAARTPAMVLDGFGYADRLGAALIARRRRPPRVILTDCTWKAGANRLDARASRLLVRAIDGPHATFCVLSEDDRRRFPSTWGIAPERVRVVHWYHGLSDEDLARRVSEDGPIFSGGRSLRDFRALVAAAADLPYPVHIAADDPPSLRGTGPPPSTVTVAALSHAAYIATMASARAVVMALEDHPDRSSGQMTYLAAMALGKTVIATDTLGVRDYVEPGRTGLIVPPNDPEALRDAIVWSQDPGNADEVTTMRARARHVARTHFSPDRYAERLLGLVDEVTRRRS